MHLRLQKPTTLRTLCVLMTGLAMLVFSATVFVVPARSSETPAFSGVNHFWWDSGSYNIDAEYTVPYACGDECQFHVYLTGETWQYVGYYVGWDWMGSYITTVDAPTVTAGQRVHIKATGSWTSAVPVRNMSVTWVIGGNGEGTAYSQNFLVGNMPDFQIRNALAPALLADVDPCQVLLFRPGTHNANASVTDQYLACETQHKAARETVQTAADLLAPRRLFDYVLAMRSVLGHVYWLDWLYTLLRTPAEDLAPTEPPTEQPPSSPGEQPTTPEPAPEPDPGVVARLLSTLPERRQGPVNLEISDSQRRSSVEQCVRLTRVLTAAGDGTPCESLPVLFVGEDARSAAEHDLDAMASRPALVQLHYRPANRSPVPERWKNEQEPCRSNNGQAAKSGLACDEYPFRATLEHGYDVSLRLIDLHENRREGVVYAAMLNACGLRAGAEPAPFLVVPLVFDDAPDSHYVCGLPPGEAPAPAPPDLYLSLPPAY